MQIFKLTLTFEVKKNIFVVTSLVAEVNKRKSPHIWDLANLARASTYYIGKNNVTKGTQPHCTVYFHST